MRWGVVGMVLVRCRRWRDILAIVAHELDVPAAWLNGDVVVAVPQRCRLRLRLEDASVVARVWLHFRPESRPNTALFVHLCGIDVAISSVAVVR
jgi:hypothetical protein